MTTDYKNTVFLPRTDFPMRAGLPQREPEILAWWREIGLDDRIREVRAGREKFILHDGPPYANGHLHIGHALNKILKDVINRSQHMAGKQTAYVPGWDCHGLPIEWKIEEEYRARGQNKDDVPIVEFRRECRAFADKWIDIQREEFRRLGVTGLWDRPYTTMAFAAEAQIAREIGKFLLNGSLYKGSRPVMWSVVEKTALADAEVEYHDHVSTTIHVRFPVVTAGHPALEGAAIVIWTTTPWTMPGNRAVACGDEIEYAVVEVTAVAREQPGQGRRAAGVRGRAAGGFQGAGPDRGADGGRPRNRRRPRRDGVRASAARPWLRLRRAAAVGGVRHRRPGHRLRPHRPRSRRRRLPARPEARHRDPADRRRRRQLLRPRPAVRRHERAGGQHEDRGHHPRSRRAGGARQAQALLPALLALQGAADLPQHRAVVHLDGDERPARHRAAGDRRHPVRAGQRPDPAARHDREPPRLVHQPAARLGGADPGVREQADRRAVARPGGAGARRPGVRGGGRRRLVRLAAVAVPRQRLRRRRLRAGLRHLRRLVRLRLDPQLRAGGRSGPGVAGLAVPRGLRPAPRLVPLVAAGGLRHPRPGALRRGAHPRLRARPGRAQDVEVARQRHRARRR